MRRIVPLLLILLYLAATSLRCGGSVGTFESTSSGTITTSISGRVATENGAGVPGVTVQAVGTIPTGTPGCSAGGSWSGTGVTDSEGRYTISGSSASGGSGTVTVTPLLPPSDPAYNDFVLSPVSHSFEVSSGQYIGTADFTAHRVYAVSGTVRDDAGAPLPETEITLLGTDQKTAVTGSDGSYLIRRVLQGPQTVAPSLPSYTFHPLLRTVTVGAGDATGIDFTGTYIPHRISGHVTVGGQPLPEATLSASGPSSASSLSGSDGAYDLGTLPRGVYNVTVAKTGYQSVSQSADLNAFDLTIDFVTAPLTNGVYGRVTDLAGASVPGGVAITASGHFTSSTSTAPSGSFLLGPLPTGVYTITPSTACPTYDFTPPSRQVEVAGSDIGGVDFTAAFSGAGASSLGGRVLDAAGIGLQGIRVAASGSDNASVVTGSDGSFSLAGLHNGSYELGPSEAGLRFSPVARAVSLCDASVGGQDFREVAVWERYGYLSSSPAFGPGPLQAIRPIAPGFLAGGNPGFRILRIGPYGDFVWGVALGRVGDDLAAISEDADDAFAAAGTRNAAAAQPAEAIVVRMGGDGAVRWYRRLVGPADVVGKAVALLPDNGVLLAGMSGSDLLLVKFAADGNILWQRSYGGYIPLAVRAEDSGATIAASEGAAGRILVLRVDAAGNVVTAKGYRRPPDDSTSAAAARIFPDGRVIFTGGRNGKIWAMAAGSEGTIEWQREVEAGIGSYQSGFAVLPGPGGTATIIGRRLVNFDEQAIFVRLSSAGDPAWTRFLPPAGWPNRRVLRAAFSLADGRIAVAGDLEYFGSYGGWLALQDEQGNGCSDSAPAAFTAATTALSRYDAPVTAADASLAAVDDAPVMSSAGRPPNPGCGR